MTGDEIDGQRTAVALIAAMRRQDAAAWASLIETTPVDVWGDVLGALACIGVLYVERASTATGLDPEQFLDVLARHALH